MDSTLLALAESLSRFVEKDVRPRAHLADDDSVLPADWSTALCELGCFALSELDGEGAGLVGECIIARELAHGSGSLAVTAVNQLMLLRALSTQRQTGEQLSAQIASGAATVAVARFRSAADVSQPVALGAPDAAAILLLPAYGDRDSAARIVARTPLQLRGEASYEGLRGLHCFEVEISDTMVIDAEQSARLVAADRILLAAAAAGLARGALGGAIAYAKDRIQFGRPIAAYGEIQAILTKAWSRAVSADASALSAAREFDQDACSVAAASMAFVHASHAAVRVAERAQHVYGGYGHMREYPVGRYLRDARTLHVLAGQLTDIDRSLAVELALMPSAS